MMSPHKYSNRFVSRRSPRRFFGDPGMLELGSEIEAYVGRNFELITKKTNEFTAESA